MDTVHLNNWLIVQLISKLAIYGGAACCTGGGFVALLGTTNNSSARFNRYIILGAITGLLGLGVNFLAQVGDFSASGLAGAIDPTMMQLLWQSPIGDAGWIRGIGFIVFIVWAYLQRFYPWPLIHTGLYAAATSATAYGFSLVGHTNELGTLAHALISAHIAAAFVWAGSLPPLRQITHDTDIANTQRTMHRFGCWATALVLIIVAAGAYLLLQLLGTPAELFSTPYGNLFAVKLLLVSGMLLLGALHKWRSVPGLVDTRSAGSLRTSITVELILALLVLLATAIFTTVMGPAR